MTADDFRERVAARFGRVLDVRPVPAMQLCGPGWVAALEDGRFFTWAPYR